MNINLHIERLILEGLPTEPHTHAQVQAAVETELARLLTMGELRTELAAGAARRSLPTSMMQLPRDARPQLLGEQIAGAVYQQLAPSGE